MFICEKLLKIFLIYFVTQLAWLLLQISQCPVSCVQESQLKRQKKKKKKKSILKCKISHIPKNKNGSI